MNELESIPLVRRMASCPVLPAIDEAARSLAGAGVVLLQRRRDTSLEVFPGRARPGLPQFCAAFRSSREGRRRCLTCRSLVTFGATWRGEIEYSCHGGVRLLAMAVRDQEPERPLVILLGPYAADENGTGWSASREKAHDLGVDLRTLHAAWQSLPVLTAERRHTAIVLLRLAATVLGQVAGRCESDVREDPPAAAESIDRQIQSALFLSLDEPESLQEELPSEHGLVKQVVDLISDRPDMRFSVSNIARAANMTPNHFSTIFHKHTGETFSDFLTRRRLALAENYLRDLSLNIADVARLSGFPSARWFSRVFQREYGTTPTRWRRKMAL